MISVVSQGTVKPFRIEVPPIVFNNHTGIGQARKQFHVQTFIPQPGNCPNWAETV